MNPATERMPAQCVRVRLAELSPRRAKSPDAAGPADAEAASIPHDERTGGSDVVQVARAERGVGEWYLSAIQGSGRGSVDRMNLRAPGNMPETMLRSRPRSGGIAGAAHRCRATSFTMILVGRAGVNVFEIRSFTTDNETRPFGVTGQEQQETNCSSGENVYTFTHTAPVIEAEVPDCKEAPCSPVFVMLMTESARLRLGK